MSTCIYNISSKISEMRKCFLPWLICLSAGLFFFYVFFQLNAFDVINHSLRAEFKLDATQLSWMSSSFVWANVIFLLPAGFIIDRFSVRYVILVSMFMCILGTFGFALAHSFVWGFCFHALTGAANAFCFISCVVLVSRWFAPRQQAFVIGCIVTMAFLGGMVAHTPLAYLNDVYGWRKALLIDSVVGLLLWLWILFIVRDRNNNQKNDLSESYFITLKKVLANRNNFLCGIYTSCLNLPIMVLCALWGSSYLHVVHHMSQIDASNIVSLIYVGSILGCPLLGWISDKQRSRKPLMFGCAFITLLLLGIILYFANISLNMLSVMFFMLGFFTSAQVISYPYIAESNPTNQTGLATSIASVIVMGGGGVGQVLFGWLMQNHAGKMIEKYSMSDFNFAMRIFPIAIIISLVAILFAYEKNN